MLKNVLTSYERILRFLYVYVCLLFECEVKSRKKKRKGKAEWKRGDEKRTFQNLSSLNLKKLSNSPVTGILLPFLFVCLL